MFDIQIIRENPEMVKENIKKKFQDEKLSYVNEACEKDRSWRTLKQELDLMRHEKNDLSSNINLYKKEGKDITLLLALAKELPEKIKKIEEQEEQLSLLISELLKKIPNIMHSSVPLGKDASENVVRAVYGKPTKLGFEPKPHAQIIEDLGIADFEASRRGSGNGFFFLKGPLALLNQALIHFGTDFMASKGYTFVEPPLMIHKEIVEGVLDYEFFKNMVYKIENEDLFLIATSEHPLIGSFNGVSIPKQELPVKLFGYSQCFRKEIGSHGIEEKGLFRTHQFNKVEQIIICEPEKSWKYYDELTNNSVEIYKLLGLPVRVLESCSGDLGDLKAKGSDLEIYSPVSKKYFETGSCSNLTDCQARRSNIRVSSAGGSYYPHTLNNTVIATSRCMVGIIENFQTKEGEITIPEVLRPYMFGMEKITRNWKKEMADAAKKTFEIRSSLGKI